MLSSRRAQGEPRANRAVSPVHIRGTGSARQGKPEHNLVRDPSLDDAASLLPPDVIAREIVEDLEAVLSEFAAIAEALQREKPNADGTTD